MSRRSRILFVVACALMLVLMAVAACARGVSSRQDLSLAHGTLAAQNLGAPEGSENLRDCSGLVDHTLGRAVCP